MGALHEVDMDLSTHTSREKAGAFESEKSSSLYFELILTELLRSWFYLINGNFSILLEILEQKNSRIMVIFWSF